MDPQEILEACALISKRKIHNGWEPCYNALFDFYVPNRYFEPALIKLEDVGLYMYLRKNYQPGNHNWKPPGVRQIMRRLDLTYSRWTAMSGRLEQAWLLRLYTEQGRKGEYRLYDPIQTLPEFLTVANSGLFGVPLREECLVNCRENRDTSAERGDNCRENRDSFDTDCRENLNSTVAISATHNILNTNNHHQKEQIGNGLWPTVLEVLHAQLPDASYQMFLAGSELICIDNGRAVVGVPHAEAIAWLQNRMSRNVRRVLGIEAHEKIEAVEFVVLENDEAKRVTLAIVPSP